MKLKIIFCMILTLCLCACFSSPSSKFYVLNAIEEASLSGGDSAGLSQVSICVGPVLLAEYLDRKPICIRDAGNKVRYLEYHRWVEALDAAVSRVLVEDLSLLLGTSRINVFPWTSQTPADYQVRIMLLRFDGKPGVQAVLKARWSIEAAGQQEPVFDTMSNIVEPTESDSHEDLVRAKNKALEKLSREIASVIVREAGRASERTP